jgi:CheY-like chemotaxis protein
MRNKLPPSGVAHGTYIRWEKVENQIPVVFIVEDDELVQGTLEEALTEGGFSTAVAPSAEEAVSLLKAKVANYRALVTDINLTGTMSGWEVARQARQVDPTFPVVYITGAAANDWASQGAPNSVLLEKPFAPAQLVTALSQLLNDVPPSQS